MGMVGICPNQFFEKNILSNYFLENTQQTWDVKTFDPIFYLLSKNEMFEDMLHFWRKFHFLSQPTSKSLRHALACFDRDKIVRDEFIEIFLVIKKGW